MILTCPACATSYFVPDQAVGPNGRKVRCQSCGEVWRAGVDEPLELTQSPPPPPTQTVQEPEPAGLAETPAPELPRAFRARAEQQRRLRRAATQGAIWAALASVFVGLLAGAWLFRVEVVRLFPAAAAAYAGVGAPVNVVGLDFEAISAREAPGRPGMVLVSGALRNVREEEIVSPPIRIALMDDHGAEVGFKVVAIDAAPVLPGKVQGFAALVPDPGGHTAEINVDFAARSSARPAPAKAPAASSHEKAAPHAEAPHAPHQIQTAEATEPTIPISAKAGGLRPASLPGAGTGSAVEARPLAAPVDTAGGEAVSPSHHG